MPRPAIEHVVVLMLENRSFDHLLGFLGPRARPYEGLTGTESVPVDPHDPQSQRVTVSAGRPYVTKPDPGHELDDVTVQLFGTENPQAGAVPSMDGFVFRYLQRAHTLPSASQVMECFEPDALPALATLAREFVVCDHWFSSVPGPTWPNRFFVHCATSGGETGNPLFAGAMGRYTMPTIYELLERAGKSWAIYYGDIPQCIALHDLRSQSARRHFRSFSPSRFRDDIRNGTLPNYTFIEPRYFGLGHGPANDQHASHHVRYGEDLVADVYEAIRSVEDVWKKTMLIVLYDEHGGFYDHVPPGSTDNPDGFVINPQFDFTRLGVRVPCVLISPFVERGGTMSDTMDHTSILATLHEWFSLPEFLTERDRNAATFASVLTLDEARDTPTHLDRPLARASLAEPAAAGEVAPERLTDLQQSLVALAASLDEPLTATLESMGVRGAAEITSEETAGVYVRTMMERFLP